MPSRFRALLLMTTALAAGCGGDSPSGPNPNPTPAPTAAPTPAPVAPAVSNADLVLLMHMDEAAWSGAANEVGDASGLAHHGSAVGGATTAAGRFGRAGSFPGGAGCVAVPDRADLRPDDALTLSMWMNPSGVGREALGVIAKRVSFLEDSAYALYVDENGALGVDVDTEDNRFFTGRGLIANGRWTHVAVVYGGGIVTAYVNGSPAAQSADSARSLTPFRSPLWVGCLPLGAPAQGFVGLLDEVAIWHRALSGAEVSALANATGPIANP